MSASSEMSADSKQVSIDEDKIDKDQWKHQKTDKGTNTLWSIINRADRADLADLDDISMFGIHICASANFRATAHSLWLDLTLPNLPRSLSTPTTWIATRTTSFGWTKVLDKDGRPCRLDMSIGCVSNLVKEWDRGQTATLEYCLEVPEDAATIQLFVPCGGGHDQLLSSRQYQVVRVAKETKKFSIQPFGHIAERKEDQVKTLVLTPALKPISTSTTLWLDVAIPNLPSVMHLPKIWHATVHEDGLRVKVYDVWGNDVPLPCVHQRGSVEDYKEWSQGSTASFLFHMEVPEQAAQLQLTVVDGGQWWHSSFHHIVWVDV